MKIVVITRPDFFVGEADIINKMLCAGLPLMHIRKPMASIEEVENLILNINPAFADRLVLHDFHSLAVKYNLYGVHLNGRNPYAPDNWHGSISRSTHSLAELIVDAERYNYSFLSPVFNSISKENYNSGFTLSQLKQAALEGVINDRVYALGGVTADKVPLLKDVGFGGAALLGEVWNNADNIDAYISRLLSFAK